MSNKNSNVTNRHLSLGEIFKNIANGITGVWMFIILAIFPIYTHNKYFDILGARYRFFMVWAISFAISLAITGILYLIIDGTNHSSSPSAFKRFLSAFSIKSIKKYICITDFFMLAMIIVCTVSVILSEFKTEAFFGSSGRYQGLECWILYALMYIGITRTYKIKSWYLDVALLAGCFASIWCFTDFMNLDYFGFLRGVTGIQRYMFTSTVGNYNTFTNYMAILAGISAFLFMKEKNLFKLIFYVLTTFILFMGHMWGMSDNAALSIFAIFLFLGFFSLKTRRDLVRYMWLLTLILFSIFIYRKNLDATSYPKAMLFSTFISLAKIDVLTLLFIPMGILSAVTNYLLFNLTPNYDNDILSSKNYNALDSKLPKIANIIYAIIVIVGFAFIIYVCMDINVWHKHLDLWKQIPRYHQLVFNDDWGTHRGHNWRIAFTNFKNFSLPKKLFGYGPDTYLIVTERTFFREMQDKYGEVYDSAHNEYINYLICQGILGLISYLGIAISSVYYGIKNSKYNNLILACTIGVLAYLLQAIVNIAIPITTPIFFSIMFTIVAEEIRIKSTK